MLLYASGSVSVSPDSIVRNWSTVTTRVRLLQVPYQRPRAMDTRVLQVISNLVARMFYGCGLRVAEPLNLRIAFRTAVPGLVAWNTWFTSAATLSLKIQFTVE